MAPPAPARVRGRADGSALALAGGRAATASSGRRPATSLSRAAARGASAPSRGAGRGSLAAPPDAGVPRGSRAGAARFTGRSPSRGRAVSSTAAPRCAFALARRSCRSAWVEQPAVGQPSGNNCGTQQPGSQLCQPLLCMGACPCLLIPDPIIWITVSSSPDLLLHFTVPYWCHLPLHLATIAPKLGHLVSDPTVQWSARSPANHCVLGSIPGLLIPPPSGSLCP